MIFLFKQNYFHLLIYTPFIVLFLVFVVCMFCFVFLLLIKNNTTTSIIETPRYLFWFFVFLAFFLLLVSKNKAIENFYSSTQQLVSIAFTLLINCCGRRLFQSPPTRWFVMVFRLPLIPLLLLFWFWAPHFHFVLFMFLTSNMFDMQHVLRMPFIV